MRFDVRDYKNLAMLMDFYELTMSNAYLAKGMKDTVVYFDMFFRKVPDDGGFAIMAGLEQLIEYVKNLKFKKEDIEYLRSKNIFNGIFLEYLSGFKFTGDIWAIPEGTPIFPNEPIVTVKAPIIEAQLIETMLLLTVNHQSLIATKANRIVRSAKGRDVMEFGARRSQGYDGSVYGARASYIGGCIGTATTLAGEMFNIPTFGTMAHSWIQIFNTEYEAFKTYAESYPDNCILLVDTYNVLKSGVPNAIRVAKEILEPMGKRLKGIRLDSGDIAYLSKEAREILNKAGLEDCKIIASNSLDEYIISSLLQHLMPYGESMKRTGDKNHAMKLINKFGFDYFEVDITNSVNTIRNSITAYKDINIEGLPVNNIKSRVRMTILYTIGQSKDYLVAGTGNLSEEVMGYFTKWGDGACDFNPIGSFTKTEVRLIARELGIPNEIIDKAPSAGLWAGQTDEEEMGVAYEDIDNFIINGESATKEATAKIKRAYEITKHKRTPIPIFTG